MKILSTISILLLLFSTPVKTQIEDNYCGTSEQQQPFSETLTRPTLSGLELTLESTNFVIHYTESGEDATTLSYAQLVSSAAELSWDVQVNDLQWQIPPSDDGRGGNNKYDIYVRSHSNVGAQGITRKEVPEGWNYEWAASYIEITNDLTNNINRLKVTVAHEFNHACQFSYTYLDWEENGNWFYENTAAWIENIVYPDIDDYLRFFEYPVNPITEPSRSINHTQDSYWYGGLLWPRFLSEWKDDISIVRYIWARMGTNPGGHTVEDIDFVLNYPEYSSNLNEALLNYGIWRYFTGSRATAGQFFSIASLINVQVPILASFNYYPSGGSGGGAGLFPLGGCKYMRYYGSPDMIKLNFTGQYSSTEWRVGATADYSPGDFSEVYELELNSSNYGEKIIQLNSADGIILIPVLIDGQSNFIYSAEVFPSRLAVFENRFINTNLGGELKLNEVSVPLPSGSSRYLGIGQPYQIKTLNERFPSQYLKHNNWNNTPGEYFLMFDFGVPSSGDINKFAQFLEMKYSRIEASLEGTFISGKGNFYFQDPWFVKSDGTQPGDFWRPCVSPYEPTGKEGATEKGVFLNQGWPNWEPPYYSVEVDQTQSINLGGIYGTRNFYFLNWSAEPSGGADFQDAYSNTTPVVFKDEEVTVKANLKGNLLSSDQNGVSSNSQRKIVRSDNGIYHVVYQSLGQIWYTHSTTTDYQGTWTQDSSLSAEYEYQAAKNPSMDYYGNNLAVVFEGRNPSDEEKVVCLLYNGSSWLPAYELAEIQESYYGNAKPVVAYTPYEVFVCYKKSSTEGLRFKRYYNSVWSNEFTITGTDVNSINPSIACKKALGAPQSVHIAYQSGATQIKYVYCYQNGTGGGTWSSDSPISISALDGYTYNENPSVSLMKWGYFNYWDPIVSWTGRRKEIVNEDMLGKGNDQMMYVYRLITRPKTTGWGSFYVTGSYVNYSNNNSATGTNQETVITFSANGGAVSKWLKRTSSGYSNVSDLSHNGKQIQVSGGNNLNLVKALAFNTSSLPYSLNKITTEFELAAKITVDSLPTFGRTGVVYKDGVEFVFFLGDMLLNGENVMFIERADTLPVADITELNDAMRTNTFYLDSNSDLYFSVFYYVINTELADSVLTENDVVRFRVELISAENNQVIGTFDDVVYSLNNLDEYNNIDYKVDCSGIGSGNHYFRLVTGVEGDAELNLSNVQNDNEMLLKKNYQTVKFNTELLPKEYTLEQNYPNPFNPTTTIRYQLPNDGIVTLKVYDILGAEVATLVNEEKTAGRYEVNFDASKLASGVYIYRLNVNDPSTSSGQGFICSKKMILLK